MSLGGIIFQWTGPVLQFALVLVFWNRRIFLKKFPAFFRYTSFSIVATILQILVIHNDLWYFWIYWINQAIYGVLALLVMREVFQAVWDMQHGFRRFVVWLLMLAIAIASAWWGARQPAWLLAGVKSAFYVFMTSVHVVEVVLCGLAVWLVRRLTQYHIGIMMGFGISAIAQVLAYVGHFYGGGPLFKEVIRYAPLSAYMAAAGTWLYTFLSRPKLKGRFDPDAALELLRQQEEMAAKISEGLGWKWPGKKNDTDKECAASA
jgi:hypothetical protein